MPVCKVAIMNAYTFSVFKRANRSCYSVSFKDSNRKFLSPISNRKRTEAEALQVAFQWLRDGIPQKQTAIKVKDLSLKDAARTIKTKAEAEILLIGMKRTGWVKAMCCQNLRQPRTLPNFCPASGIGRNRLTSGRNAEKATAFTDVLH
jgi:hypothetical protein